MKINEEKRIRNLIHAIGGHPNACASVAPLALGLFTNKDGFDAPAFCRFMFHAYTLGLHRDVVYSVAEEIGVPGLEDALSVTSFYSEI